MFSYVDAQDFAKKKLKEVGLAQVGWRFTWDNSPARFGQCRHKKKEIGLSSVVFFNIKDDIKEDEAKDTILHEIAHALTPGSGHGNLWKTTFVGLGGSGKRCYDKTILDDGYSTKYTAECPSCGFTYKFHRLTNKWKRSACGNCCRVYNGGKFSPDFKYKIIQHY